MDGSYNILQTQANGNSIEGSSNILENAANRDRVVGNGNYLGHSASDNVIAGDYDALHDASRYNLVYGAVECWVMRCGFRRRFNDAARVQVIATRQSPAHSTTQSADRAMCVPCRRCARRTHG